MDQKKVDSLSSSQQSPAVADLLDLEVSIYDENPHENYHRISFLFWRTHPKHFDEKFRFHSLVSHEDLKHIVAKLQQHLDRFS